MRHTLSKAHLQELWNSTLKERSAVLSNAFLEGVSLTETRLIQVASRVALEELNHLIMKKNNRIKYATC